ncbi:MAG: hypothetical protein QG650_130 [Patescibacteria group bacterium]|nr:hypothetical protein [Patescibacteria group bacterium]
MEDLTFQLNSGIVDVPKGRYLPDWISDSYDPLSPPCLHDLLTLFDLVGFSHRSATLYSKIA